MKTRPLTTFTFVMILVLVPLLPLFEATPVAAQELQPPIHSPQEPPLPPGVGKHKKLDRSYHVPGSQMGVPGGAPGSSTRSVLPLTTGGPDSFGYRWNDAIAASWVMGATDSGLTGDDAYSSPLGIGFTFNFYGRNYTQLYAGTNGFLTFGQGATDYWNQAIPNPWSPNNFIAPFWDDLDVGTLNSGKVYTKQGVDAYGKYFVVEWRDVSTLLSPSDTLTFEVVLHENGNIALQYQSLSGDLASATVGIEDDTGTDGLLYLYSALGLSNGKAVTFTRPAASARAKVSPAYQGNFISAGAAQPFKVQVSNTGDLGADTYDLSAASTWAVSFFAADGVAPLTDTNGNGVVDTGSMAQGAIVTVTVKVQASTTAGVGASNSATITARSSKNAAKSSTANLRTAVPAPFAQVYRDDADGAMSLYLVQPSGQSLKKTTANGYAANGDQTAVAEMPNGGFAYVWSRERSATSATVQEIQYAIVGRDGSAVRPVTNLTDLSLALLTTFDYHPTVAVAPDGRIGVAWYRQIYNSSTDKYNFNVFFAILNADGSVANGPGDVTANASWATYGTVGYLQFVDVRVAATSDNRFVLTWTRSELKAGGFLDDIYYTIRSSGATQVKGITRFTNATAGVTSYGEAAPTSLRGDRLLLAYSASGDINYAALDSAGNTVKSATDVGGNGWYPDAAQLADGRIFLSWAHFGASQPEIDFGILDGATYGIAVTPRTLANPLAPDGDDRVSVTADSSGRAILTWTDYHVACRHNLYYALVNSNGAILTPPMAFRTSQTVDSLLEASRTGYGNATFAGGVFLPVILDNAYGGWNTGVGIRNTSPYAARVQITYYNGDGNVVGTDSQTVAANGYWGNYQGGKFGGNWAGSATVYSLASVVATVNEVGPGSHAMGYTGDINSSRTLYLPGIMDNALGGWTTGIGVKNTSAISASVTISYYRPTGSLITSETRSIPANGYWGAYQGGKLGSGVIGSAVLTSNQPMAAVVNEVQSSGNSISHNGLRAGGTTVNLPVILNNAYGGWTTWAHIQNTSASAATGSINYYDSGGILKKTQPISLVGRGYTNLNTAAAGLRAGFTGSR